MQSPDPAAARIMTTRTTLPLLLADIGGTTTRLARAGRDGVPVDVRLESNDSHASLEDLLRSCLDTGAQTRPRVAVLAVACPVEGEELRLSNRAWRFSPAQLITALELDALEVVNDFVALAHGVPCLGRADLMPVGVWRGGAATCLSGPALVCGPGTGLGAALILPDAPRMGEAAVGISVLPSEAGHMRFGAVTTDEARLLAHLVRDLGAVAVEHVLSGPGLERMHYILSGERLSSHTLIKAATDGRRTERETCDLFLRVLGRVLGDLTLAFEARGGVYIGGGIGRALAPLMADSPLRTAFEDHPPFAERLARVPVHVITHATPGLLGAGRMGQKLLAATQNR